MAIEYTDTIETKSRDLGRKSDLGAMRMSGDIPAVIYGPQQESKSLSVHAETLVHQRETFGANHVYKVNIDGQGEIPVLIREIKREPISNRFEHVDFFAVAADKEVVVKTPILTTGKCIGVVEGGRFEQYIRTIKVKCLPSRIPEKIELDVTELRAGDDIRVRDLPFSEGARALVEGNVAVVRVVAGGARDLMEDELGAEPAAAAEGDAEAPAEDAAAE
tara:strand:- start:216 stop:872 length:657 start_codon:yes stop_codon:yes gene_type:complete